MPICIRKDGLAKKIAIDILGPPPGGIADSSGNPKKFVKKRKNKDKDLEERHLNRFEEIGYR